MSPKKNDMIKTLPIQSGISSVGRAFACQAKGRQFEPGIPLQNVSNITFFLIIDKQLQYIRFELKGSDPAPSKVP